MKPKTYRQKLAQVHAALGHPRRLRLIEILSDHPEGLTFEDLGYRLRVHGSTLGHHVRVLMHAGFLSRTIRGPYSIYTYTSAPLAFALGEPPFADAA